MHKFRRTLAASDTLRVGIVWRGNPAHQNDRFRSLKLTQLLPLAEVPGVTLYSLQKGAGREELASLSDSAVVVDLAEQLHDFYDTAALVASLDVVVGCDTSVAHLAGALAMPAWVMLPAAPDWRWLRLRTDSPWYPTVKLLRQQRLGNWEDVVSEAAQSLKRFAPGVHERP